LSVDGDSVTLQFDQPQRAVSPGQSAVIFAGDVVLGGGRIAS
jgi:tRNA-specific 2-thiouridylase